MGIMQGKVVGKARVVVDSFALPVQGTETRVNAANEANEYMVQYVQGSEQVRLSIFYSRLLLPYQPMSLLRYLVWRTRLAGITLIQVIAAGFRESR